MIIIITNLTVTIITVSTLGGRFYYFSYVNINVMWALSLTIAIVFVKVTPRMKRQLLKKPKHSEHINLDSFALMLGSIRLPICYHKLHQ